MRHQSPRCFGLSCLPFDVVLRLESGATSLNRGVPNGDQVEDDHWRDIADARTEYLAGPDAMRELTRGEFNRLDVAQLHLLEELADLLRELESRVVSPVATSDGYRFANPSEQQRRVIYLAHLLSSAHAQRTLVHGGHVLDAMASGQVFDGVVKQIAAMRCSDDQAGADREGTDLFVCVEVTMDAARLMSHYMSPGPGFQVAGVVASPTWYREYELMLDRLMVLLDTFGDAAVAFGHPGMRRYAQGCASAFREAVSQIRPEVPLR